MMIIKHPILAIVLLSMSMSVSMYSACGSNGGEPKTSVNGSGDKNPLVTITMEGGKKIYVELYPDIAPNTVNSFLSLVKKGFYDGVIFHRVIPGFMIQGGDPEGSGQGGPGYMIFGEFSKNNFENNLKHTRGVLSMARRGSQSDPASAYNTAGSQFFLMVAEAPHLDNEYAGFGKVIQGLDVVDQIVGENTDRNDKPLKDQKIKTMTANTFGVEYPEPQIIAE
jgi:peptidyl-prolyl cis-trans isomerase B (cyclophilin B)